MTRFIALRGLNTCLFWISGDRMQRIWHVYPVNKSQVRVKAQVSAICWHVNPTHEPELRAGNVSARCYLPDAYTSNQGISHSTINLWLYCRFIFDIINWLRFKRRKEWPTELDAEYSKDDSGQASMCPGLKSRARTAMITRYWFCVHKRGIYICLIN